MTPNQLDLRLEQRQDQQKTIEVVEPEVQFNAQGNPTGVELKKVSDG